MKKLRFLGTVLSVGSLIFLFVWEHVQATRLGYEVEEVRKSIQWQRSKNAFMKLELERLASPLKISEEAAARLAMVPPKPDQIVLLGPAAEGGVWEKTALLSWLIR